MASRRGWVGRIVLLVLAACVVLLLRWAHRVGEAKFTYEVTPLDRVVTIPFVYDYYAGSATRVGERSVKVRWGPVEPTLGDSTAVVTCTGTIPAGGDRCYVLALDGALYVERSDFIEPVLAALEHYERHGELPPALARALADPELDRNTLAEVLAEMGRDR
jgi:hypothetical protein